MVGQEGAAIIPKHRAFRDLGNKVASLMKKEGLKKSAAASKFVAQNPRIKLDKAMKALAFALAFPTDDDLRRLGRIRVVRTRGPGVRAADPESTRVPMDEVFLRRLGIVDRAEREKVLEFLEREPISFDEFEGWLRQRKRDGPSGYAGGRRPEPPRGAAEALAQVQKQSKAWLRLCEANWADREDRRPDWQAAGQLRGKARKQLLRDTAELLAKLKDDAAKLEGRLLELAGPS